MSVVLLAAAAAAGQDNAPATSQRPAPDGWRVMPIRSQEQFQAGQYGGEAEQHPQGMARSPSHPDIVYVSHDVGQVWKSTDAGRTWRKTLGAGLLVKAGQSIEADPVDPNTVLAIADSAWNYLAKDLEGVYRSVDGGENWKLVLACQGHPQRFHQEDLAYDPASVAAGGASRWYAALPNNGLYRSQDGGRNWTLASALPEANEVYCVQPHPSDGRTVYLASSLGLLASAERGKGLRPLGDLPAGAVSCVWVNPKDPSDVLAVADGRGLYRSGDSGRHFRLLKAYDAKFVFVGPAGPERMVLAGGAGRGLVSHDGGRTWQPIQTVRSGSLSSSYKTRFLGGHTAVLFDPRDANAAVGYSLATLWRSADGGRTFVESATGFTGFAAMGSAFDAADPNRFALFCCDVGMVLTDNGGQWFSRSQGLWDWYQQGRISWMGMYRGDIEPVRGSRRIVASVGYYFQDKLVHSDTAGAQWRLVCDDVEDVLFVGYHRGDPNVVYAGRKRSTDGGRTWTLIEALRPYDATIAGMCLQHPDTVYAVGKPRKTILRSDDRGATWRVYAKTDWYLNRLDSRPTFAADPKDPEVLYTLDRAGDLARFDGKTWKSLGVLKLTRGAEQKNFIRQVALDGRRPRIIYAEAEACGLPFVFRSLDGGASWQDISANLPRCGAGSLAVHPLTGDVFHGSMAGTWLYPPPYDSPGAIYPRLMAPPAK